MLTEKEYNEIVDYAKQNKLQKGPTLEYIYENYVDKETDTAYGGRGASAVRKIKDNPIPVIGIDLEGNPIIDSARKKEIESGFKIRTEKESARSDPAR